MLNIFRDTRHVQRTPIIMSSLQTLTYKPFEDWKCYPEKKNTVKT